MLHRTSTRNRRAASLFVGILWTALLASPWAPAAADQAVPCQSQSGQIGLTSVPSTVYSKSQAVNVYLPPCYDANRPVPYPVIYLLHGGDADETQWPDLNVQVMADTLISQGAPPFVVVMPGAPYGVDYTTYVIRDLLPGIASRYRVQTVRSGRAIGGLSLGGYWALRIALLHPDLFAAVGGFSPVVTLSYPDDPLRLARQATVRSLQGLRILLDVGNADSLAYDTNQLARALRAQGITVALTVGQGGHERPYWRGRTGDYFIFFLNSIAQSAGTTPEPSGVLF